MNKKTYVIIPAHNEEGRVGKVIEEVLKYLIDDGKVFKTGHIYKPINEIEWEEDFMKVNKPLAFQVPYLHSYNRFSDGSMIIIGSKSGQGKTHCAVNFLERSVKQGIYPRLLCTEAGSKFGIISATRGLKVGDYGWKIVNDPSTVELVDNGVTILDWLSAPESDYSKMESIYSRLNDQLKIHGGLLIIFAQLKSETGGFYAQDMTKFYGSFVGKYLWTPIKDSNGGTRDWDNTNTYIQSTKMRDSKIGKQYIQIPMHYNDKNKEITLRGIK